MRLKFWETAISSQVYTKQHIIVVIGELAVLSGQVRDKFESLVLGQFRNKYQTMPQEHL